MANGPYVKVFQSIVDDPAFERVYYNDRALATWLRMLMLADALYPTSAPLPSRTHAVRILIECGLVEELPGGRYTILGLRKARAMQTQSARNAAAVRWQSEPYAYETKRNETRREGSKDPMRGASVPVHDGRHLDCAVCGT